eukprot:COSAG02_NODE_1452_length_12551_cov_15.613877_4_plen_412_part_00
MDKWIRIKLVLGLEAVLSLDEKAAKTAEEDQQDRQVVQTRLPPTSAAVEDVPRPASEQPALLPRRPEQATEVGAMSPLAADSLAADSLPSRPISVDLTNVGLVAVELHEAGVLGITLEETHVADGKKTSAAEIESAYPRVTGLRDGTQAAKYHANSLVPGLRLVAIQGTPCINMPYESVVGMLQSPEMGQRRPLQLQFGTAELLSDKQLRDRITRIFELRSPDNLQALPRMLDKNEGKIPVFYINLLRKYDIDPAVMFRSSNVAKSGSHEDNASEPVVPAARPAGPEDDAEFASLAPAAPAARPATLDPTSLVETDVTPQFDRNRSTSDNSLLFPPVQRGNEAAASTAAAQRISQISMLELNNVVVDYACTLLEASAEFASKLDDQTRGELEWLRRYVETVGVGRTMNPTT